jgi:ubiquinone/menaquinone biosynthesis C-methylase UbiE
MKEKDMIFHYIEKQRVSLKNLMIKRKILDIGGGGEGIIGKIFQDTVVSIDPSKKELEEAADGPLKIVMDGTDLKFLDETFASSTSFFTFMFIPNSKHEAVIKEIYRVLKTGGKFYIWDVKIPEFDESLGLNKDKTLYVVPLLVNFENEEIDTGYGTKWYTKTQSQKYFINLCESIGFKLISNSENGETFKLVFIK